MSLYGFYELNQGTTEHISVEALWGHYCLHREMALPGSLLEMLNPVPALLSSA